MAEGKENKNQDAYKLAVEGWEELNAAANKIQKAADLLKKSENSIDGYNIERALIKHKPDMMEDHLRGLLEHIEDKNG